MTLLVPIGYGGTHHITFICFHSFYGESCGTTPQLVRRDYPACLGFNIGLGITKMASCQSHSLPKSSKELHHCPFDCPDQVIKRGQFISSSRACLLCFIINFFHKPTSGLLFMVKATNVFISVINPSGEEPLPRDLSELV